MPGILALLLLQNKAPLRASDSLHFFNLSFRKRRAERELCPGAPAEYPWLQLVTWIALGRPEEQEDSLLCILLCLSTFVPLE